MKLLKRLILALAAILLLATCIVFFAYDVITIDIDVNFNRLKAIFAKQEHGWELTLVNRDNPIPDDYELTLWELANGQMVDTRIYPALQQMFDDMRAAGIYPYVASGYRTQEYQQALMDDKIRQFESEGYHKDEARRRAEQWVALPGTSEHQLGIAVDINADVERSTSEQVYSWLEQNAHKYGFIQRYPESKSDITGIAHEPWHYRYVGVEHAKKIYEKGMCLEEYIDYIN